MKDIFKTLFHLTGPADDYRAGFRRCSACHAKIPLDSGEPLHIVNCPSCACPEMMPMEVGDYLLIRPLGAGGMGSVYKAVCFSAGGEYAVKILPRAKREDPLCIRNIMTEGEVGKLIGRHRNIVPTVACGIADGEYFLASEYCKGERLDELIELNGPFQEKEALNIIIQLTNALFHIANTGYLYRDIKPENVLLEKNGLARLFDFGLCLSLEEAANPDDEVATFAGSPLFVPPERVVGDSEGEFSDIYTLGLLFFYILSGRTYYTADEMLELVKKHVTAIRISSTGFKLKHCTEHTVAVLDKMIQRDPEDRYQTFRELIPDIQQAARELHLS